MTNSARAQNTNPLTDASMIALQVVRTSLRECMGSCFPPPPLSEALSAQESSQKSEVRIGFIFFITFILIYGESV